MGTRHTHGDVGNCHCRIVYSDDDNDAQWQQNYSTVHYSAGAVFEYSLGSLTFSSRWKLVMTTNCFTTSDPTEPPDPLAPPAPTSGKPSSVKSDAIVIDSGEEQKKSNSEDDDSVNGGCCIMPWSRRANKEKSSKQNEKCFCDPCSRMKKCSLLTKLGLPGCSEQMIGASTEYESTVPSIVMPIVEKVFECSLKAYLNQSEQQRKERMGEAKLQHDERMKEAQRQHEERMGEAQRLHEQLMMACVLGGILCICCTVYLINSST